LRDQLHHALKNNEKLCNGKWTRDALVSIDKRLCYGRRTARRACQ